MKKTVMEDHLTCILSPTKRPFTMKVYSLVNHYSMCVMNFRANKAEEVCGLCAHNEKWGRRDHMTEIS